MFLCVGAFNSDTLWITTLYCRRHPRASMAGKAYGSSAPLLPSQRAAANAAVRTFADGFGMANAPVTIIGRAQPVHPPKPPALSADPDTHVLALASCQTDGVADGWIFAATPHGGLWAWHSECGSKVELIREATAPFVAAPQPAKQHHQGGPHDRRGHRAEGRHGRAQAPPQQAPTPVLDAPPALPLYVASNPDAQKQRLAKSTVANAVAVVPSGRSESTVCVISVVDGRFHALHLRQERTSTTSNVVTLRHVVHQYVGGADAPTLVAEAFDGSDERQPPTLESVAFHVAPHVRPSAKRSAILVKVKGKHDTTAIGTLTVDAPRMTKTIGCKWVTWLSRRASVSQPVDVRWLGDSEDHIVARTVDERIQIYALQTTSRSASAVTHATFAAVGPATEVTLPGVKIAAVGACTHVSPTHFPEGTSGQRSVVSVAGEDNSVQLLHVRWAFDPEGQVTAQLVPVAAYVFPPARETIAELVALDEETLVASTNSGRVVRLVVSGLTLEVSALERPAIPGVETVNVTKQVFARCGRGVAIAHGNALVLPRG